ncbi:hypothetical protein CP10139811_0761 [Chlamydia ibidis]|uniref:Uncharacterized protein n=2 Tax=Chlamydia ibidis TaxID=1405396 RepID=S7J3L1_9CHLA|nr:hypothetical protein CP10139811_0761 [Chlamydia ibidis]EQM63119.1 hypothetical protein H359_0081 [Chlamydia ibidis 10-1398/6]
MKFLLIFSQKKKERKSCQKHYKKQNLEETYPIKLLAKLKYI